VSASEILFPYVENSTKLVFLMGNFEELFGKRFATEGEQCVVDVEQIPCGKRKRDFTQSG
jgi:hypothetical protein